MRRSLTVLTVLSCAVTAAGVASAQVPSRVWSIAVRVDTQKPGGAAWDAFGGAPDVALCAASAAGSGCAVAEGTIARCQDSFSCTFTETLPTTGFSLSLWDVDVAADDLIGTCYVDRPGTFRCGASTITVQ